MERGRRKLKATDILLLIAAVILAVLFLYPVFFALIYFMQGT